MNATVDSATSSASKAQNARKEKQNAWKEKQNAWKEEENAWKVKAKQWREQAAHHEAEAAKSSTEAAAMERIACKMMKQRDVQRDRLNAAREKRTVCVETRDWEAHGQPYFKHFEEHARRVLSTGNSARGCRLQLEYDARYIMGEDAMDLFVVPKENWWKKMRESMGMESWVYGMLEICKADAILQFGFDETAIDLQSTMNM